jgi:hypothetical protein
LEKENFWEVNAGYEKEGDKSTKGIMKRKKGIIFRIIFDGSCAVFNIVRGKITKYTSGEKLMYCGYIPTVVVC